MPSTGQSPPSMDQCVIVLNEDLAGLGRRWYGGHGNDELSVIDSEYYGNSWKRGCCPRQTMSLIRKPWLLTSRAIRGPPHRTRRRQDSRPPTMYSSLQKTTYFGEYGFGRHISLLVYGYG